MILDDKPRYQPDEVRKVLIEIKDLQRHKSKLMDLVLKIDSKVASYHLYIEEIDRYRAQVDEDWIDKGEEPSEFFMNEQNIDFNILKNDKTT